MAAAFTKHHTATRTASAHEQGYPATAFLNHPGTGQKKGDANDTRAMISRIAKIRAEKAQVLGYPDYATWKLQDQMAKTPAAVEAFFNKLIPAATAKAGVEAKDIQALIVAQKDTFSVQAWDWDFYADQVRKSPLQPG